MSTITHTDRQTSTIVKACPYGRYSSCRPVLSSLCQWPHYSGLQLPAAELCNQPWWTHVSESTREQCDHSASQQGCWMAIWEMVSEPRVNKWPHQANHCVWVLGLAGNMIISHVVMGLCNKKHHHREVCRNSVLFSAIQQGVNRITSLSHENKEAIWHLKFSITLAGSSH